MSTAESELEPAAGGAVGGAGGGAGEAADWIAGCGIDCVAGRSIAVCGLAEFGLAASGDFSAASDAWRRALPEPAEVAEEATGADGASASGGDGCGIGIGCAARASRLSVKDGDALCVAAAAPFCAWLSAVITPGAVAEELQARCACAGATEKDGASIWVEDSCIAAASMPSATDGAANARGAAPAEASTESQLARRVPSPDNAKPLALARAKTEEALAPTAAGPPASISIAGVAAMSENDADAVPNEVRVG